MKRTEAAEEGVAEVVAYLNARIASHRKGVSMVDARDLAVNDVLRKFAKDEPEAPPERRSPPSVFVERVVAHIREGSPVTFIAAIIEAELARVEAERDELKRAEADSKQCHARNDEMVSEHLKLRAELRKRDAVIEAARAWRGCHDFGRDPSPSAPVIPDSSDEVGELLPKPNLATRNRISPQANPDCPECDGDGWRFCECLSEDRGPSPTCARCFGDGFDKCKCDPEATESATKGAK